MWQTSVSRKSLWLQLCCLCCLFVLKITTVAAAIDKPLIPNKNQQNFEYVNRVYIKELTPAVSNDPDETFYTFTTQLKIISIWHKENAQILQVTLSESDVNAATKHNEKLIIRDILSIPDDPFYISLVDGQPPKIIAHPSRDQSLLNLERGIASLLQVQHEPGLTRERSAAGLCNVLYKVEPEPRLKIYKSKTDCSHWDLRVNYRDEPPFSVWQTAREEVVYEFKENGDIERIESIETHKLELAAKSDVGSIIESISVLKHMAQVEKDVEQLTYDKLMEAIESSLEWYRLFNITADVDGVISELNELSLEQQIVTHKDQLSAELVGSAELALTFLQLLPIARITKQKEFSDILKNQKDLRPQLVDLLGAAQSIEAHNAINEVFPFNDTKNAEILEKYLQALGIGTRPNPQIIEQLLQLINKPEKLIEDEKLHDTIVQTVAALTRKSGFETQHTLQQQVREYLISSLAACTEALPHKQTTCKTLYIRAFGNLQDRQTVEVLLAYAIEAQAKTSVAALQTLKAFPLVHFHEVHRKIFEQIFYQKTRKYDSSARAIALDILLAMKPDPVQLGYLLDYLASNDRQYEIKTYVLQKFNMLADKSPKFRSILQGLLAKRPKINNYHVFAQKGLTTVLQRDLTEAPAFEESLLSAQEVEQGILKRGTVEVLLKASQAESTAFTLGIYTNNLNSFVGNDDGTVTDSFALPDDESDTADDTITAGMEIAVQGISLRPLVFFNGNTELMSHIWGGTASEPLTAYEATTVAQDHEHYMILASGATVFIRVLGARSIGLNGKVDFSIWNRNAQTEIVQNTGAAIVGHIAVGFTYGKVVNEFVVTYEPKLNLKANLDFYTNVKLCMQLQRPELILTHNNTKSVYLQGIEKPYTKRIVKRQRHISPGRTLALNQKNNEMCNIILSE